LILGLENHILTVKWEKEEHEELKMYQEIAREKRLKLLHDACQAHDLKLILLGHNVEDDLCTLFQRICKNSRLDGLGAMRLFNLFPISGATDNIFLGKPLLSMGKERLISTCKENGIKYLEDRGNVNLLFLRNRASRALAEAQRRNPNINAERMAKFMNNLKEHRSTAWKKADAFMNAHVLLNENQGTAFLALYNNAWINDKYTVYRVLSNVIQFVGGKATPPKFSVLEQIYNNMLHRYNQKIATGRYFFRMTSPTIGQISNTGIYPVGMKYISAYSQDFFDENLIQLKGKYNLFGYLICREKLSHPKRHQLRSLTLRPNQEHIFDNRFRVKFEYTDGRQDNDTVEFKVETLEIRHIRLFLELYPCHPKKDVLMEFIAKNPSNTMGGQPVFAEPLSRFVSFPTLGVESPNAHIRFHSKNLRYNLLFSKQYA
jgi:tRNA(Ile)-lysidine synthase TilS/MesJ